MKFFTRAKKFLRWCIATPVRTGKHRQSLTDCEKEVLLKMISRSVQASMDSQNVTVGKENGTNESCLSINVHKARTSEHNK